MSGKDIRMLMGGYAAGTLTGEERRALMEAALEDQTLFEELAREEPLRDLLSYPVARAHLLAALDEPAPPFHRRLGAWMWERALGVGAVACFVAAAGYFAWQARFSNPERIRLTAVEPTTVEVTAKAPPRREFDVASAAKAAARKVGPLLIPPPAEPLLLANRRPNLPPFLAGAPAHALEPAVTVTAPAAGVTVVAGNEKSKFRIDTIQLASSPAVPTSTFMPIASGGRAGAAGAPDSGVVKEVSVRAQPAAVAMTSTQVAPAELRGPTLFATLQERNATLARQTLASKFAPAVAALAEHARTVAALTPDDKRLIGNGEANLRLTLTNFAADSLGALRQTGFTITRQDAGDVEGHIAPAKLYSLAQLTFVASIKPQ